MKFSANEIATIMRQHAIDTWNIPDDAIEEVIPTAELRPVLGTPGVGGAPGEKWFPVIIIKVKTKEVEGGGPYRSKPR